MAEVLPLLRRIDADAHGEFDRLAAIRLRRHFHFLRVAAARSADAEILETGRKQGMRTLREDGDRWLASGLTSLEEVIRVTGGV